MVLFPLLHMVHISGWMFFIRMFPLSSDQLEPLEDVICLQFIPTVTGRNTITEEQRDFIPTSEMGAWAYPSHTRRLHSSDLSLKRRVPLK